MGHRPGHRPGDGAVPRGFALCPALWMLALHENRLKGPLSPALARHRRLRWLTAFSAKEGGGVKPPPSRDLMLDPPPEGTLPVLWLDAQDPPRPDAAGLYAHIREGLGRA